MEKARKKRVKVIVIAGIAVLAAIALFVAFAPKPQDKEQEAETTTAEASVMTIENTLSSDAEVTSSLEEDLEPHTSYYLEKVKVEAGDAVKEGDTILTYTNGKTMTAPYNCVVKSWSLPDEEDQLTTDHYVTVAGTDVMQVELEVGEDEVSLIKPGDSAKVQVSATNSFFDGVVTSVSEVGEYSDSGSTFTAKITFDNDGEVKLGMSATAMVTLDRAENVLGVPVNAVSNRGDKSVVTVQKNGKDTEEVEVTTGISNDAFIEIKSGLEEGDVVIVPVSEDSNSNGFMNMPGGMDMNGGPPNFDGGSMPDFDGGNMPSFNGGEKPSGPSGQ